MVPGVTAMYWLNVESACVSVTVTWSVPVFAIDFTFRKTLAQYEPTVRVEVVLQRGDHVGRSQGRPVVERDALSDRVHPRRRRRVRVRRGQPGRVGQVRVPAQQALAHVRQDLVGRVVEGVGIVERLRLGVQRPGERVDVADWAWGCPRSAGTRRRSSRTPTALGFAVPLHAASASASHDRRRASGAGRGRCILPCGHCGPRWRGEDELALDVGAGRRGCRRSGRTAGERVAVEHDEVGERARRQPPPSSSRWFTYALPAV